MDHEKSSHPRAISAFVFVLMSLLSLVALKSIGSVHLDDFLFDLGSNRLPAPRYGAFLMLWMVFGSLSALLLASGMSLFASTRQERVSSWIRAWNQGEDSTWIVLLSACGALLPFLIRSIVTEGAPVADDESAYQFMAEVLALGQVKAASPPLKLFFDRGLMINDGHLYAQYFLGWPALMAPGAWFGSTGVMNALYSAITVPGLFLVLRRVAGSGWARLGGVLYLSSPMLMIAAATQMSHTSCMMALVWTTWFVLRSRDDEAPWWSHAGVGLLFSLAFFIRPTTALGIGLPLLAVWGWGLRGLSGSKVAKAAVSFLIPATAMAALFLSVNYWQNGDPLLVSYQKVIAYQKENSYRFSSIKTVHKEGHVHNFNFDVVFGMANSAVAALRLNAALLGWPFSLAFAVFGFGTRRGRLFTACIVSFLAVHLFVSDVGIDTFGPTHFFELAWPLLVLTIVGVAWTTEWIREHVVSEYIRYEYAPVATVLALLVVALVVYTPLRLNALSRISNNINMPHERVQEAGLSNAIVFTPRPFARNCLSAPTAHFVFWRPNNDPLLQNSVLWANHIDVEEDRKLMEKFPDRVGYVMVWDRNCRIHIPPLANLKPGDVPDAMEQDKP